MLKNQVKVARNITAATNAEGNMVYKQQEIEEVVLSQFSDMFQASYTKITEAPNAQDHVKRATDELDNIIKEVICRYIPMNKKYLIGIYL